MYLRCFQIILNFSFSHLQQQDKISSPKKIPKKRAWGESGIPASNTAWGTVTQKKKNLISYPGSWGATNIPKKKVVLQASEEEHKQKSPNLLEYHTGEVTVEAWEVAREAISPGIESSTLTSDNTWVAGFLYITTKQLEIRDYQKYIIKDGKYHPNPSQYKQAFSYQKAGQRSRRDTDWYIPKFKRIQPSRFLWRHNTCWLPYKNWIVEAHNILITKETETVNNKISYLSTELAQEILSFFLWRPSNVPNSFSDHYRKEQYWKDQTSLEPPRTPEHLCRFKYIDQVPRIKKTQAEIKRVLIPGTAPPTSARLEKN